MATIQPSSVEEPDDHRPMSVDGAAGQDEHRDDDVVTVTSSQAEAEHQNAAAVTQPATSQALVPASTLSSITKGGMIPVLQPNAAARPALLISRHALNLSSHATALGFQLAKRGTAFGFNFARNILSPLLSGAGAIVDHGLGTDGGIPGEAGYASRALGLAVGKGVDAIEWCTMFGIGVGESTTQASLAVAQRSVATLEDVYGNDEAVRALGVFVGLVRREWSTPMPGDPPGGISQFGVVEVARATALWALLQSVTESTYARRIAPELEEVDLSRWRGDGEAAQESEGEEDEEGDVLFEITDEEILSSGSGEIITAEVHLAASASSISDPSRPPPPRKVSSTGNGGTLGEDEAYTRNRLKRYAKLCLSAYGGMGLLFFGVPVPPLVPVPPKSASLPAALAPAPPTSSGAAATAAETPGADAAFHTAHDSEDEDDETQLYGEGAAETPRDDELRRYSSIGRGRKKLPLGRGPTSEELATLERRLEESHVASAWSPGPSHTPFSGRRGNSMTPRSPPTAQSPLSQAQDIETAPYSPPTARSPPLSSGYTTSSVPVSSGYDGNSEAGYEDEEEDLEKSPPLRAADFGLPYTPEVHRADRGQRIAAAEGRKADDKTEAPVAKPKSDEYTVWDMLTGKRDVDLLSRIGGVDPGAARLGATGYGELSDSDTNESESSSEEDENGEGEETKRDEATTTTKERLPSSSRMPASELAIPEPAPPSEPPSPEQRPLQTKIDRTGMGQRRGAPLPKGTTGAAGKKATRSAGTKKLGTKKERKEARLKRRQARKDRKTKVVQGRRPPRYFIISDHPHRNVVVCLRGTMSVDDIATDLTCEVADFEAEKYWDDPVPHPHGAAPPPEPPAADPAAAKGPRRRSGSVEGAFTVHTGFLEIATAMGGPDGPVTRSVARALKANPDYELVIVGHSLGAGIASLLGLIWADPRTCKTTKKSGLPEGVKVKVYGFAPPCSTSASLSRLARPLIHSFAYSSDAVTRLSLGHICDIRSAAAWLCYVDKQPQSVKARENVEGLWKRILAFRRSMGKHADGYELEARMAEEEWLTSLRKTLEANMTEATLFPPGDVFWLVLGDDIELPGANKVAKDVPRLFRVTGKIEVVFSQMLFTRRMLMTHLPSSYADAVQNYL